MLPKDILITKNNSDVCMYLAGTKIMDITLTTEPVIPSGQKKIAIGNGSFIGNYSLDSGNNLLFPLFDSNGNSSIYSMIEGFSVWNGVLDADNIAELSGSVFDQTANNGDYDQSSSLIFNSDFEVFVEGGDYLGYQSGIVYSTNSSDEGTTWIALGNQFCYPETLDGMTLNSGRINDRSNYRAKRIKKITAYSNQYEGGHTP